jgi:hypothetical protein
LAKNKVQGVADSVRVFLDANGLFYSAKMGAALAGLVELLTQDGSAVTSALAGPFGGV